MHKPAEVFGVVPMTVGDAVGEESKIVLGQEFEYASAHGVGSYFGPNRGDQRVRSMMKLVYSNTIMRNVDDR